MMLVDALSMMVMATQIWGPIEGPKVTEAGVPFPILQYADVSNGGC